MGDYSDIINKMRPVSYRKHPMERAHRAKQFAAFDALKGYGEAVCEQEESYRQMVEQWQHVPQEEWLRH